MGLSLCWISVEARHRTSFLEWFDLKPAGESYDELGSDFTLTETKEGWLVLVANGHGFDLDEALTGVSSVCGFAVGAEISEVASFSRACAQRNGAQAWSISFDAENPGDGLKVDGEPPAAFGAIRSRAVADQVAEASSSVAYAFDAPIDLAANVVGYRTGETRGLEWTRLEKRDRSRRPSARHPKSLRAAMVAELLPFLRSLGWDWVERPVLTDDREIYRHLNGTYQSLWFDYASGAETYIIVHFGVWPASGEHRPVFGHVAPPFERLPLWKRFTWKRFAELTRSTPPPEDIIGATLDGARRQILQAEDHLRTGVVGPCIRIDFPGPSELWPPSSPTLDKSQ